MAAPGGPGNPQKPDLHVQTECSGWRQWSTSCTAPVHYLLVAPLTSARSASQHWGLWSATTACRSRSRAAHPVLLRVNISSLSPHSQCGTAADKCFNREWWEEKQDIEELLLWLKKSDEWLQMFRCNSASLMECWNCTGAAKQDGWEPKAAIALPCNTDHLTGRATIQTATLSVKPGKTSAGGEGLASQRVRKGKGSECQFVCLQLLGLLAAFPGCCYVNCDNSTPEWMQSFYIYHQKSF